MRIETTLESSMIDECKICVGILQMNEILTILTNFDQFSIKIEDILNKNRVNLSSHNKFDD